MRPRIPKTASQTAAAAPTSDALLDDARKALQDGDAKRALELADKAVAAEPSSAEARLLRAGWDGGVGADIAGDVAARRLVRRDNLDR